MKVIFLALATLVAAALLVTAAVSGGTASTQRHPIATSALLRSSASQRGRAVAQRRASVRPMARTTNPPAAPGSLPQTHVFPSAGTARFKALMAALWAGVVSGRVAPAIAAFFPRGAYVQLKAISGASSDWSNRLVHDYALDIGAAHALLGSGAASARLLEVRVTSSYGHWVPPGVCYNDVGYYELPNARVVYSEGGRTRSFGIASMISWRGVWYVVHLGAILRSSDIGMVDEPALGRGTSAYSGTC